MLAELAERKKIVGHNISGDFDSIVLTKRLADIEEHLCRKIALSVGEGCLKDECELTSEELETIMEIRKNVGL
jgi:hypothetical protein